MNTQHPRVFVLVSALGLAGCKAVGNAPSGPSIAVTHLQPVRVLPTGPEYTLNVNSAGSLKRVKLEIEPHGNTVPDAEVHLDYEFNRRSDLAMDSPRSATVRRKTGSPTTRSEFYADIVGSKDLDKCEWFHYRWVVKYVRPGETTPRGVWVGALKNFQILTPASGPAGDPCPGVP